MKRPTHLPARDLELLSAYIDGALPAAQAARLESRLREDADLHTALEEIRAVALALRNLPPVPVPRDFTLREADVPARRPAAYPVLSLATGLATLAFIVVFGLDTWARGSSFGAGAPLAAEPGAPEGQALEVGPSMAERAADMGDDATPTPPAESLMAGSSPATAPSLSPTPTPTVTPTPAMKELDEGRRDLDLLDRLKIGFGVLALGLAGVTLFVRRKRL